VFSISVGASIGRGHVHKPGPPQLRHIGALPLLVETPLGDLPHGRPDRCGAFMSLRLHRTRRSDSAVGVAVG
jgi:hypothetical protein